MERLLVIKADVRECEAEVLLNGVPLARLDAARPRATVPVHEYTLAGANRLELVVWPRSSLIADDATLPKLPLVSNGRVAAQVRILLPRVGNLADESGARTLAQLDWAPPQGQAYEAPHALSQEVNLPVSFPRWRWLDAPLHDNSEALRTLVFGCVQAIATDLAAGQTDRFIGASRLRTEELAVAYLRQPADETTRLREHLLQLHADGRLTWLPLEAEGFFLRSLAGGRMFECLDAAGLAALRTAPDDQGRELAFPLRVSVVEGKVFILR
jgi:hypothetical protein